MPYDEFLMPSALEDVPEEGDEETETPSEDETKKGDEEAADDEEEV